jgi:D-glycero-D-manno-heptose 1,7-bisphosphate phosphatase
MLNKAVFIDRDGTLIEDRGYICDFDQVEIFPFSFEATRMMNENGFKVIVVTNQSSIARGICTEYQVQQLHDKMEEFFRSKRSIINAFYYCPFYEYGVVEKYKKRDDCRKPLPGMILKAAKDFNINLNESFMIGDNVKDVIAGHKAGCKTMLVKTGNWCQTKKDLELSKIKPYFIFDNVLKAAFKIIELSSFNS